MYELTALPHDGSVISLRTVSLCTSYRSEVFGDMLQEEFCLASSSFQTMTCPLKNFAHWVDSEGSKY